jgi:hypothetical protein
MAFKYYFKYSSQYLNTIKILQSLHALQVTTPETGQLSVDSHSIHVTSLSITGLADDTLTHRSN